MDWAFSDGGGNGRLLLSRPNRNTYLDFVGTAALAVFLFARPAMSLNVQVFGRRDDGLATRRGGRRPKSAKARNRGGWGTLNDLHSSFTGIAACRCLTIQERAKGGELTKQ